MTGKGSYTVLALIGFLCFHGARSPYVQPTHLWPLGEAVWADEFFSSNIGGVDAVSVGSDGLTELIYKPLELHSDSYADLPVPNSIVFGDDFSFQFFIFPNTSGDIFHYRGIPHSVRSVTSISVMLTTDEYLNVTVSSSVNTETRTDTSMRLTTGHWHFMAVGRDISLPRILVHIDGQETALQYGSWLTDMETVSPGTLRIGRDASLMAFTGMITCLHVQGYKRPGIYPLEENTEDCNQAYLAMTMTTHSNLHSAKTTPPMTTPPMTSSTGTTKHSAAPQPIILRPTVAPITRVNKCVHISIEPPK